MAYQTNHHRRHLRLTQQEDSIQRQPVTLSRPFHPQLPIWSPLNYQVTRMGFQVLSLWTPLAVLCHPLLPAGSLLESSL